MTDNQGSGNDPQYADTEKMMQIVRKIMVRDKDILDRLKKAEDAEKAAWSRWSTPKRYPCEHDECTNRALILSTAGKAHNCCNKHGEGDNND